MKHILLSTAYFPSISWMAAALQSERVEIETHETYPKQTYRNRCNIATSSGILSLTVPVKRVNGNHTQTGDVQIDNTVNWQLQHWRSIVTSYNKSPYFLYYRDLFEPVFVKKQQRLVDLNMELLLQVFKTLQISNKEIFFTTRFTPKPLVEDMRNCFHPKPGQDKAFEIDFPRYMQAFEEHHGFIKDLSIIDLIFNLGPEALPYLANMKLPFQS